MSTVVKYSEERAARQLRRAVMSSKDDHYPAIIAGFAAKGIDPDTVKPRENVLTFGAWRALGRMVRKGEHGVKIGTPGEWQTTVFHISQTDAIGDDELPAQRSPIAKSGDAAADVVEQINAEARADLPAHPMREKQEGASYQRIEVYVGNGWSVRTVPCFSKDENGHRCAPDVHWVMKDGRQIDSYLKKSLAMKAARDFASGKREFVQRAIRRDLPEGVSWAFHDHRTQGEIARARKPRQVATPQIEPLAGASPLGVKRTAKSGDARSRAPADIAGSGERICKAPAKRTRAKAKKPAHAKRQPQGRFVPPAASRIAESVEASSSVPAVVGWRARVAKLASMLGLH